MERKPHVNVGTFGHKPLGLRLGKALAQAARCSAGEYDVHRDTTHDLPEPRPEFFQLMGTPEGREIHRQAALNVIAGIEGKKPPFPGANEIFRQRLEKIRKGSPGLGLLEQFEQK